MPSPLDPVKKGASATATALETTAGVLRRVAGDDRAAPEGDGSQPQQEAPREEAGPKRLGSKPPAATRQRISNPKAAKKVRARKG